MFKKTEETEWTRFSKALSSREREEAEAAPEDEPAQAAVGSPASRRDEAGAAAQPTRQVSGDVNVSSRAVPRPPITSDDEDIESTIGEQTTVDGTFRSESSIRVRGTVQGEIESRRSVLIEAEANVTAKVTADSVTVAGRVNGQIHCSGRVEIRPSGRVVGEIHAATLIMQEGAFFEGHLKMGSGQANQSEAEVTPVSH